MKVEKFEQKEFDIDAAAAAIRSGKATFIMNDDDNGSMVGADAGEVAILHAALAIRYAAAKTGVTPQALTRKMVRMFRDLEVKS